MRYIFTWAAIFILGTTICLGQERQIGGLVTDTNGDALPGAIIKVRETGRTLAADQSGEFSFKLRDGEQNLVVSAVGFAAKEVIGANGRAITVMLVPQRSAESVIVSGAALAGMPEDLRQIAGSVEKVNAETLERSRVFNFSEALRKISGVTVREEEGFGLRPNIGIRGTNPTRSTKVLLLEDGIPLSYAPYGDNASYYHPPVERYASIETLKGSGQIVYGPVTLAGVVNYITPNPPVKPTFSLSLRGGNRRFFDGTASFGATVKRTGFYASYTRKQGDGARENTSSKLNDIFTKITHTLDARNALAAKFSLYGEDSNVTYSGLTEAEYAQNPRGNIFKNDFFYGRRYGLSLNHAAVLTDKISLSTNVYGAYFSRDWWRQSSNSGQRPNRLNVDPDCRGLADLNTTCGNEGRLRDYLTIGFEPRLTANFSLGELQNEFSVGVRVHWEKQDREQVNGDLPNSRTGVLAERNLRKNLAYSAFFQNRFLFGKFAVTPGVRVEKIEYQRQNLLGGGSFGKTSLTQVVPGLGVAYSGIKRTTVFAGVHRGFSPPRTEDVVSNMGGVVDLDSELSWNYEAGVRSNPARGLALEGAFFRNDYENQIVPASLAGGVGATLTNGGLTLQQGMEFSGQFDSGAAFGWRHNFYLRAAYTFLALAEFRGRRFSSISGFGNVLVTGNRLPYAPKENLTTSVGYAHPKGFDAFIENVFIGRQFTDDLNTVNPIANGQRGAIPAQTYWNATANYRVEKWHSTFFVTAKNLFDRTLIVDRSRGILPSSPRLIQAGWKLTF